MTSRPVCSPRAIELAALLDEQQREYIVECNTLVDKMGFVGEPSALGREVMDLVRWEAQQQEGR